jgi:hypothetical protein
MVENHHMVNYEQIVRAGTRADRLENHHDPGLAP